MTINLVDGKAGTPHIGGADLGDFKLGFCGSAGYVLETGDRLACTVNSANKVTVATGSAVLPGSGRHVRVTSPESLTVTSGTQGQKRNDLVVLRPSLGATDTCSLVVVRGTPTTGTPADPAVNATDLKLYRLPITDVNLGTPVALFDVLTPLAKLRDSVSQESGESGIWRWWRFSNGMKVCQCQYSFSVASTPLNGGFYYAQIFKYLDLPFSFTAKSVYVSNGNKDSSEIAFAMGYEVADNRTASRIGGVNVIRWDNRSPIAGTANILVVGY